MPFAPSQRIAGVANASDRERPRMCTLVVLHRSVPGVSLLVAANRDEFFDRRAEGPALRRTPGGVSVVAPRDARGGGTWLGLSSRGLFAALTNVAGAEPDPRRRSRGLLVLEALEAASAREAALRVGSVAPGTYNAFNLFVADAVEAFAVTCRGEATCLRLAPGAHVLGNVALDAPPTPKVERLREQARRLAGRPLPDALAGLSDLCRGHREGDPLGAACVHTERYGTRSSALLALADRESESSFAFADGAPCENEYRVFTPLLHELARGTRPAEGESVARMVS
jgi:uncharacterized protein with NRDE domain